MPKLPILCAVAAMLITGCATQPAYERVSATSLISDRGHVVGHREVLRNVATGEETERVVTYSPRYDANGEVSGYEEPLPEGTLIRTVDGRRVGVRYRDLRGRGVNPSGDGVSVTVGN